MKRYRELDLSEVLRMLADDRDQVFAVTYNEVVYEVTLSGIDLSCKSEVVYSAKGCGWHRKVYEIIKIPDPLIPLKKLEALQELYPEHEWIAMDEDKIAFIYTQNPPAKSGDEWWPERSGLAYQVSVLDGYAKDWRESLIHIPTEIDRIKGLGAEV